MISPIVSTTFLIWILFIPVAILNGLAREKLYKSQVGELRGHQLSTVSAIILFWLLAYALYSGVMHGVSGLTTFLLGVLLVVMTILFECGFGHFVDHLPWSTIWSDYNLLKGRIWILFLLTELVSPYLVRLLVTP